MHVYFYQYVFQQLIDGEVCCCGDADRAAACLLFVAQPADDLAWLALPADGHTDRHPSADEQPPPAALARVNEVSNL